MLRSLQGSVKFNVVHSNGWKRINVCDEFAHKNVAISSYR